MIFLTIFYAAHIWFINGLNLTSVPKLIKFLYRKFIYYFTGREEHIWLHVDAAYAGSFLVCPEFKYLFQGLQVKGTFGIRLTKARIET